MSKIPFSREEAARIVEAAAANQALVTFVRDVLFRDIGEARWSSEQLAGRVGSRLAHELKSLFDSLITNDLT
jgi:hypothetical protein